MFDKIRELSRNLEIYGLGDVAIQNVNFKIMIDNPRASDQFKAGESGWWLTVYKATSVTMHEAIAMAHAVKETAGEEEKV